MSRLKKMYKFVSRKEDNWASIVITAGRYSGIIYQYGRIALNDEEDAEGNLTLSFDYNIIDNYGISNDEIHNDFRNLLGDILVDILDDQLKEEKLEYVPDH